MKMPFPGMDPYLEHPFLWPGVHKRMVVWMAHQLRPLIRPRYVAAIEEFIYLEGPEQLRIPDVWVLKASRQGRGRKQPTRPRASSSPIVVEVSEAEVGQSYIAILDRYRDQKVVAVLELVSPTNKVAGPGREAYLLKQQQVRQTEAHLVEIDLLRYGAHVLSVPEIYTRSYEPYEYLISVNRWPQRKRFELYPCRLRERLPTIQVPLSEPDPDVPLNLQAALEPVYEDGDYMLRVKYEDPCVPPLTPEDQEWANERWSAYLDAHPELGPTPRPRTKRKSANGRRKNSP